MVECFVQVRPSLDRKTLPSQTPKKVPSLYARPSMIEQDLTGPSFSLPWSVHLMPSFDVHSFQPVATQIPLP